MNYKVNEIFYSIQTEGMYAGTPAIFVRFSGCNLKCSWCDTNHNSGRFYTKKQLEDKVKKLSKDKPIIVFTGGEPTLQLKQEEELLKGYERHIETNGILQVPSWIDWITVSPKTNITKFKNKPNEIKVVYEKRRVEYIKSLKNKCSNLFIQPLEKDEKMNIREVIRFIKKYPSYRLSLQYHKIIGIR